MKREIFFRGKRKNGQWVYGSLVVSENTDPAIYYEVGKGVVKQLDWCYVNPDTVGQYTGLKDKNGKKIFEGDIVHIKGDGYGGAKIGKDYYRVVTFHDGTFCLSVSDVFHTPINDYVHSLEDWDIVGNIIDTPELMK